MSNLEQLNACWDELSEYDQVTPTIVERDGRIEVHAIQLQSHLLYQSEIYSFVDCSLVHPFCTCYIQGLPGRCTMVLQLVHMSVSLILSFFMPFKYL